MALPSGYTQLRYIQSSGTQYIDTGFVPNQDTRLVIKTEFTIQGTNQFLYGSRAGEKSRAFCFNCYKTFYRSHYDVSWLDFATSVSYGGPFIIDHNKNVTTLNGEHTATNTYASFTCPYSLVLFAKNDGGTIGTYANAKIYECQIYDNGTLVRDFVPAKNSGGTVGLYDAANGVFYTNAGSGAFTAGPSVTGPVDGEGAVILAGVSFAIKEGTAMLNGVARKITEGMTILGGAAKKIAVASGIDVAAMVIGYTGAYTDKTEVTMSGKKYRLLTLTGSGTLTLPQEVVADVWMCAGGNGGADGGRGGGGGLFSAKNKAAIDGSVVCTIGSGGSAAKVGNATAFGTSSISNGSIYFNGASGGGSGGTGGGATTVPFGSSDYFSPHSAGGGGGGSSVRYTNGNTVHYLGGAGGSNGANGAASTKTSGWPTTKAAGGNLGGGAGGTYGGDRPTAGSNATYYGSGGGGGGSYENEKTESGSTGGGGAGYQGVIYVRIPYEQ